MSAKGAAFYCMFYYVHVLSSPRSSTRPMGSGVLQAFFNIGIAPGPDYQYSVRMRRYESAKNLNQAINSTSQCDQVNDHSPSNKIVIGMIRNHIRFCNLFEIPFFILCDNPTSHSLNPPC